MEYSSGWSLAEIPGLAQTQVLVKALMRGPVITIADEAGLDRAMLIMRTQRIRHLPVVDVERRVVGIISDRDLRLSMKEFEQGPSNAPKGYYLPALTKVKDSMSKMLVTTTPDTPLSTAAMLMAERKIGALPVMDGKELVGIITETDALKFLAQLLAEKGTS